MLAEWPRPTEVEVIRAGETVDSTREWLSARWVHGRVVGVSGDTVWLNLESADTAQVEFAGRVARIEPGKPVTFYRRQLNLGPLIGTGMAAAMLWIFSEEFTVF